MEYIKTENEYRSESELVIDTTEELFKKYAATRDPEIRERLILEHQNLVRYLAGKFANRGVPLEDLIQVGTIGLINAVDRYEPEKGFQFSTFATPTIVGEIKRYFRDKAWSLKVPRRLQELNQTIHKLVDEMAAESGHSPTVSEIANRLDISEEEALEATELGSAYDTVSLDTPVEAESGSDSAVLNLAEFVGEYDESINRMIEHGDLFQALQSLEPRERAIIYYRFFQDLSQTEAARRLGISQMHVSRLQQKALQKLKELMLE